MPNISLVVCLYKERDLLERLLQQAEGCFDDLLVVHDGAEFGDQESADTSLRLANEQTQHKQLALTSNQELPLYEAGWKSPEELSLKKPNAPPVEIARDYAELPKDAPIPTGYRWKSGSPQPGSIHELVARYGGRFFEGPRCFQQEPHWPFAWWAAKHDWILRLDADEFPSANLRHWVIGFRQEGKDRVTVGYQSIWPLWNGQCAVTQHWPNGRPFLINRQFHQFFGMVEQTAIPNNNVIKLNLVLVHAPVRKSFGVRNIVFRKQAYIWRSVIAGSLMQSPLKLPRWRCRDNEWPEPWATKLKTPLFQAFHSLMWFPLCQARNMWRYERKIDLSACLNPGLHHFLLQISIFYKRYFT